MFENIPDRVRKHRRFVWVLFIAVVVFIGFGIPRLIIDMSYSEYFEKDDPVTKIYDLFRDVFGSQIGVYIVYKPKDGDVFSEASLKAVKELPDELPD